MRLLCLLHRPGFYPSLAMLRCPLLFALLGLNVLSAIPAPHPGLAWSVKDLEIVRTEQGKHPLFDQALKEARDTVEAALARPIEVPQPADAAGYTHERHKLNYRELYCAGLLFQLNGDRRCLDFIREQLNRYAELYPTLGRHPAGTSHSPGRLFWQSLNEAVWLVHVAQAYDFVHDSLSPEEQERFESKLFRPMARFFSEERVLEFDRIHNHGTWTAAAVGMIGYAMGDQDLVDKALLGSRKDGKAGFLRQLDLLFSPDGLYCEGPYYGRYALQPFFLFASIIDRRQPDLKVFERRDGLLRKALYSELQLSYTNGAFLPYNDSLKEKSYRSPEILAALAAVYVHGGQDSALLDIARRQGGVALSPEGLALARALESSPSGPAFPYASVEYGDGPEGRSGGLGVLRSGNADDQLLLCMKYGVHGMEHGHFDKLSFQLYDQGREILPDYGSARFLNVEQKTGGRYLPENKSWALQTVAHNAVVVDGRSQFGGDYEASEASHSERHFFQADDPAFQVMSAREDNAYPGVGMLRTMALVADPRLSRPFVVDVHRLYSSTEHQYDLALHYQGQFLSTTAAVEPAVRERHPLGASHGYQHLWLGAEGPVSGPLAFTWMNGNRFYSLIAASAPGDRLLLTELGANDPHINLRREPGLILRRRGADACFASVIQPHGQWDGNREFCNGSFPDLRSVEVLLADRTNTVLRIRGERGLSWTLLLNAGPADAKARHRVVVGTEIFEWVGNARLLTQ